MGAGLVRKSTIREMVAVYQDAVATISASFAALDDAESRLNATFALGSGFHALHIHAEPSRRYAEWSKPDAAIVRLRREVWSVIVDRLELQRMLSVARWDELQAQLDKGELPDLTEDSVAAFVRGYGADLPNMVSEMVAEVYDWLRPRAWSKAAKLKTNDRFVVGPKVILSGIVERRYRDYWSVSRGSSQPIVALERVFNALDGRGEIGKTFKGALWEAIEATPANETRGETGMFAFRCCRNGNLHIEFKRADLLARFNQIAGGKRMTT